MGQIDSPPPGLLPLPSSGTVLLTSFSALPKPCNLCGHRQEGRAAAGRRGERREGVGVRLGRGSKSRCRKTPLNPQAQVSSQQASRPSAAPTFSWAPQPYLSHQPGPTSNHPPSHLHSNQSFAAPQDVGDKTCPLGWPGSHPPIPGLCFRLGWIQIKGFGLVEMKCTKLGRQTDPPSQVASGPALAPILSQSYFVLAGACAGVFHRGGLDLTHWHFAHLRMRTKRTKR